MPRKETPAERPTVTEYGCAACQAYHVKGLDPLYDEHLHRQARHHGPRERPATAGEAFALEMARA
jgi:hypothetical protein